MNSYPSERQATARLQRRMAGAWAKWEKALGQQIPLEMKQGVESSILHVDDDEYIWSLEQAIAEFVRDKIIPAASRQIGNEPRSEGAKRQYRRPLEKRLYFVTYVVREGRLLTLANVLNRSFSPHARVNWKAMLEKWNGAHPYDAQTVPLLKAKFYAAIADASLQREFFDRELAALVEGLREALKKWALPEMAEGLADSILSITAQQGEIVTMEKAGASPDEIDKHFEKQRKKRSDTIDRMSNRKGAK